MSDDLELPLARTPFGASPSFLDLVRHERPEAIPPALREVSADSFRIAHGTTVLGLKFSGGMVMAGDRRATAGNLIADAEVDHAMMNPPEDTRAYFRGRCIARFPEAIAAASWDSLIMDTGRDALQRIPMREPLRGTRAHVHALLDEVPDAAGLVERLQT